jgi:hypothetical protein
MSRLDVALETGFLSTPIVLKDPSNEYEEVIDHLEGAKETIYNIYNLGTLDSIDEMTPELFELLNNLGEVIKKFVEMNKDQFTKGYLL